MGEPIAIVHETFGRQHKCASQRAVAFTVEFLRGLAMFSYIEWLSPTDPRTRSEHDEVDMETQRCLRPTEVRRA